MRSTRIVPVAAFAAALLASCAGMKLATVTTPIEPAIAPTVQDSSLAVAPVDLRFSAMRAEFDLRDVKVTIGDQTFVLGGRYLETVSDSDLGKVGILDTNIFKKAGADVEALASYAAQQLADYIRGQTDVKLPIDREKPDDAHYSSRPLEYDLSTYPFTSQYRAGSQPLPPLFREVKLGSSGADFVLSLEMNVRSEVVEVLEDDEYIQNRYMFAPHKPSRGDYYLSFEALTAFTVSDAQTGNVVMTESSPQSLPIATVARRQIYLPVHNRDAEAYAKFFRSYDFSAAERDIIREMVECLVPAFRPMYQNINRYVKVE